MVIDSMLFADNRVDILSEWKDDIFRAVEEEDFSAFALLIGCTNEVFVLLPSSLQVAVSHITLLMTDSMP